MSEKKETALERIQRMKREKEAAQKDETGNPDLVSQLTHESSGEPDFAELADKLKARQDEKKVYPRKGYVKYTIYVEEPIAEAFNALCLERGDQRRFASEAIADFVQKKARELDLH